jgi:phage protein D
MDLPRITLTLMIGPELPVPTPQAVTEALDKVEVKQADGKRSGFQIDFNADRTSAFVADYPLLKDRLLAAGNRVVIVVNFGMTPHVLMDGFIADVQLPQRTADGGATLSVIGEDMTVKLDRTQVREEYPGLGHSEIVELVLAKYSQYGVVPLVMPTLSALASDPLERVPQQKATDLAYLKYLAALHGNVFFITPGPVPLVNTAYWGPPPRVGAPLPALSVNMGPQTNIESLDFRYAALTPTVFKGTDQDADSEGDIPVVTEASTRVPLSAEPALLFDRGQAATRIVRTPGMDAAAAIAYTQGMTDRSTDNVVTASGEVDTLRYGSILKVANLVGVRGCGASYDGFYYVNSVTHALSRTQYRQQFTLGRDGVMTTTQVVPP